MSDYLELLQRKVVRAPERGFKDAADIALHPSLFPYQADVTRYLLGVGCGAAFLDTGLGKTRIALDWGRVVFERMNKPVLMLAPLAVGQQHAREAAVMGIEARTVRNQDEVGPGINIANYEILHHFTPDAFAGIILDESSILKSFTGKTTRALMAFADKIQFRLCATATPAPNDHMELGQHCQFLDVMGSSDMLARWFIADQTDMGRYRLKRYGVKSFWSWVASWSRCLSRPSDLGYSDDGFVLPGLDIEWHEVETDIGANAGDYLFRIPDMSATSLHREKRLTIDARADIIAAKVLAEPSESWVVWCDTDYEADALNDRIPDSVEVRGSMTLKQKEERLVAFSLGDEQRLITKASIAGHGLNWQHCAREGFVGLSYSYEAFYQALRRCYRYGQKRTVKAHVAIATTETPIRATIQRKALDHETMKAEMCEAMRRAVEHRRVKIDYQPTVPAVLPDWITNGVHHDKCA